MPMEKKHVNIHFISPKLEKVSLRCTHTVETRSLQKKTYTLKYLEENWIARLYNFGSVLGEISYLFIFYIIYLLASDILNIRSDVKLKNIVSSTVQKGNREKLKACPCPIPQH